MNGPLAQRDQRPHDGAHIGGPGLTRRLAEAVQQGSPPPPVIAQRACQRGRGHPLQDQLSAGTRASRWRSGEAGEWVCADAAQEVPRGCIPDGAVAKERLKFLYTLLAGNLEEASTLAERALVLSRTHKARGNEAWSLRLLGEIALHGHPPDIVQAEIYYQQALALADELGMRPLQAHCHHGLGRLYCQIGRREPARAELSTAIELHRAMEMTFWLPQAEATLAQVGKRGREVLAHRHSDVCQP